MKYCIFFLGGGGGYNHKAVIVTQSKYEIKSKTGQK